MGQKFTWLGLFNLGQTFGVAFHKLFHSSCQSWCNWVRFVGLLARTLFFSSAHIFFIGLRSGLCDGHSNTLTLLSLSPFAIYSWGHCPFGRPICDKALTFWLMSWDIAIHIIFQPQDAIYFVMCTSPSCSKAPPQHDAASHVLHGWDGVLRLQASPFFLQT